MSRLQTADGQPFATGEGRLNLRYAVDGDRLPRLFLQLAIAGLSTEAVIDTGGAYLIVDPELGARAGLGSETAIHRDRIVIRGFACPGTVHRLPVTLAASVGEPLTFEATAFLPDLSPGEEWVLPSYLGWQGCLERIRFAVDPGEELIYFGARRR